MASRDTVPLTRGGLASTTDKAVAAKPLTSSGGVQNPAPDHVFRPSLELSRNPAKLGGGLQDYAADHSSRQGYYNTPASLQGGRGAHMQRGERGFFSSDDAALTKQIVATHAPDIDDLNVKPVLAIVEDILRLAKPSTSTDTTTTASLVRVSVYIFVCFQFALDS